MLAVVEKLLGSKHGKLRAGIKTMESRMRIKPHILIAFLLLFVAGVSKAQCVCDINSSDNIKFEAALNNLIEEDNTLALELLENGIDLNAQNACGYGFISIAAGANDLELIDVLISNGADLDTADFEGVTPVYLSTQGFHHEALERLLENGANPNAELKECLSAQFDSTPLLLAAVIDNFEGITILLEYGADFTAVSPNGATFFDILLRKGNDLEKILDIIESVPEKEKTQAKNELLFEVARRNAMLTELKYLLSMPLDPNFSVDDDAPYNTPLLIAALAENIDGVKALIERGADIHYTNPEGYSLERIIHENNLEDLYYLLPSSEE